MLSEAAEYEAMGRTDALNDESITRVHKWGWLSVRIHLQLYSGGKGHGGEWEEDARGKIRRVCLGAAGEGRNNKGDGRDRKGKMDGKMYRRGGGGRRRRIRESGRDGKGKVCVGGEGGMKVIRTHDYQQDYRLSLAVTTNGEGFSEGSHPHPSHRPPAPQSPPPLFSGSLQIYRLLCLDLTALSRSRSQGSLPFSKHHSTGRINKTYISY